MDRSRASKLGTWVLFAVVAVLWAWQPKHPMALRVGVDVIGVVMGVTWLVIIAVWVLNSAGWLRSGGIRTLGANATLRSSAPLLAALATLAALAALVLVISRIA
jgi:hypothetical protein